MYITILCEKLTNRNLTSCRAVRKSPLTSSSIKLLIWPNSHWKYLQTYNIVNRWWKVVAECTFHSTYAWLSKWRLYFMVQNILVIDIMIVEVQVHINSLKQSFAHVFFGTKFPFYLILYLWASGPMWLPIRPIQ